MRKKGVKVRGLGRRLGKGLTKSDRGACIMDESVRTERQWVKWVETRRHVNAREKVASFCTRM
jgi:hypothetical protein